MVNSPRSHRKLMQPNHDNATGIRAMLLRLESIEAGRRRAEQELTARNLPKDHLKSKYERKKPNDSDNTRKS